MQTNRDSDEKFTIENLRLISFLVDYIDRYAIFSVVAIAGVLIAILGVVFFLLSPSSLIVSTTFVYAGVIVIVLSVQLRWRYKRKLYRYLERISEPALLRSSEYQRLVSDLRRQMDSSMTELAKRESELLTREDELDNMKERLEKLKGQIESEQRESRSSKKATRGG